MHACICCTTYTHTYMYINEKNACLKKESRYGGTMTVHTNRRVREPQ